MSAKRTWAISSVRVGFVGESDINAACYVSTLTQAIMTLQFPIQLVLGRLCHKLRNHWEVRVSLEEELNKIVTNIVRVGIRDFERQHAQWKISPKARQMVLAHASQHHKHIMAELAAKKTTKAALALGLRDVLEHSIPVWPKYETHNNYLVYREHRWKLGDESEGRRHATLLVREELS